MKKFLLLVLIIGSGVAVFSQNYRLVLPKNNFVSADSNIIFNWSQVDSADSYELQVSTTATFSNIIFNPTVLTTISQTALSFGQTYYWRIRAIQSGVFKDWSYYRNFSIFKPNQLPGLVMWFDAAKNVTTSGSAVSQWNDLSSTGISATQSNASLRPTLVSSVPELCNKPAVRFNGNGGLSTASSLGFSALPFMSDYTVLILRTYASNSNIIQYVIGGINNGIIASSSWYSVGFGSYQGANGECVFGCQTSFQTTGFSVYTTQRNHVFKNTVEVSPANPAHTNCVNVSGVALSTLGARADAPTLASSYKGDIAEIVVYDNSLDSIKRTVAEKYLRYKFAPPVNLGPDTILNRFCVSVPLSASNSCFKSYVWSNGATTAGITASAFGTYWVRATDNLGFVSTDTIRIRPLISFNQLPDTAFLCAGDSVVWNTGYPAAGYQFTWSNGAASPSITIKNSGVYSVSIKDGFNCTFNSKPVRVIVDTFPNYSLGSDTSFCSGNRLNFSYAGQLSSILWSNGDTVREPEIIDPGDYSVVAVNTNGCIAKDTIHVNIRGYAPNVKFGNPILCASDSILFVDSTIPPAGNSIVWWTWNFGGNDTTNEQNPVYVFNAPGQYTISLTAVTDSGCVNSRTKILNAYLKPNADFIYNIPCALTTNQFTDFSTTPMPAIVSVWKWRFGDSDSSALKNPAHQYLIPGKYEVALKVTNSDGCTDIAKDSVEVFAPFSADFKFENVCLGDSTAFTDITPSHSIVSWLWNTGDNFTTTKKSFKRKYSAPGNYPVKLQVQNALGCVDSITKTVSIYRSPIAGFSDTIICKNQYYTPTDSSKVFETNNVWKWNINGIKYTGQQPQYFFSDTGTFPVKLYLTSQSGCKDSAGRVVRVKPNPKANFSFTPQYGDAPLEVVFTNQSAGAVNYYWNFGDGVTDILPNPTHTYSTTDTFIIMLRATSAFGCMDSAAKNIIVTKTDLDISIDDIYTNILPLSDGTVVVYVTGVADNIGTRLITDVKFYATLGSGGVISEDWNGQLQAGSVMMYNFNAHFVVATDKADSYVCVEARSVNNGETETRVDNNKACVSLNDLLQIIGPSPNPARGFAYLGLILPKPGKVSINVSDLLGRTVLPAEELDLPAGRTDYNLPIKQLRAGEYFIRIQHNDDKILKKLVIH